MFLLVVDKFWGLLYVVFGCFDWLWSSNEKCLYKGNVGFLGEMLSKFSKTHVFFFFFHNSSKLSDSNL